MRIVPRIILSLVLLAAAAPLAAEHEQLHRALHQTLGLPEPVIVELAASGLPPDHLPVVALIAARAEVPPARVVELRESGLTYVEIAHRLGTGPEIFYVPLESDPGPPYGKAWGYWKQQPRERWNTVVLTDEEAVALANVRLIADTYQVPPARAIELQRSGKDFVVIHEELAHAHRGLSVAGEGDRVVVVVPGLTAKSGYNIEGSDYTKIYLGTLGECQQACADERQCRAYTYNTRDRMCYLKDRIGDYTRRSDTVSGEKQG